MRIFDSLRGSARIGLSSLLHFCKDALDKLAAANPNDAFYQDREQAFSKQATAAPAAQN